MTRSVIAAFMLAQWFILLAFSSSERLHHSVCEGSQQPSHDCALISLSKGQLWVGFDPVVAPARHLVAAAGPEVVQERFPAADDIRLMPGRDPPAGLLPT